MLDSSVGRPARGVIVKLQRYRKITDEIDGEAFAFDPIAHGYVLIVLYWLRKSDVPDSKGDERRRAVYRLDDTHSRINSRTRDPAHRSL